MIKDGKEGLYMRKRAFVNYKEDDIYPVGEYNGKYHPYGCVVSFKLQDETYLKWNTIVSPNKVSQVELNTHKDVMISYTDCGTDELGRKMIKNVCFIK